MQSIYLGGAGSQHPQFEWTGYDEPCYGFRNISGSGNHFDHCLVWDWMFPEDPQYTWWIGSDAEFTRINTHDSLVWNNDYFLDEGIETMVEGREYWMLQMTMDILTKGLIILTITLVIGGFMILVIFLKKKKASLK